MISRKKSASSSLRHRVTLQQEQKTEDGQGGYIRSWVDVADIWAEIVPIMSAGQSASGESYRDGQLQTRTTYKIRMRYRAGVTTGMRLSYDSRVFNIRSIVNPQELGEMLEMLAEEGVAT